MTQIYKVRLAEKHTVLAPVLGDQAMVKYDPFDGHPKLPIWEPVECCVYKPRKNSTDFASFWMCPVLFSDRSLADTILKRLLKESCEFLPLAMPNMTPIMIHSTKIADCLDEGSSRIEYGVEDHWIFHSDRLPPIGQICRLGGYRTVVTIIATDSDLPPEEDFYQWYHKQGYTGLRFTLLWQSA